jgi:predicted nucleic acid-binding protein
VIVVDAGPLIALFDSRDAAHIRCRRVLRAIHEPTLTTIAVLTEAFQILGPSSASSGLLREYILHGGLDVWFMDRSGVARAFELMETYADHAMDFADASLVVAAESLDTRKVFTLAMNDFKAYRVRRGHRHEPFEIVS